jgi:hypothetical protein
MHFDLITLLGLAGGALYLVGHFMRAMVPLRTFLLCANVVLVVYSMLHLDFDLHRLMVSPEFLLNLILLPMNARRLLEIKRLTRQIEHATGNSPVSEWLLPHMEQRRYKAGTVLFRRGDEADEIYYVAAGQLQVQEAGHSIGVGELLGEIGLFSAGKLRTMTVRCETDCELYRMTAEQIYQLYYQNPKLGFYFMKLIVERLLRDVQRQRPASESG